MTSLFPYVIRLLSQIIDKYLEKIGGYTVFEYEQKNTKMVTVLEEGLLRFLHSEYNSRIPVIPSYPTLLLVVTRHEGFALHVTT